MSSVQAAPAMMAPLHASERRQGQPTALDTLSSLPLALNSTLELRAVLLALIEASLAVSDADRCSIFLLRDGRWLEPAVSLGKSTDDDQWAKFRSLPLLEIPGG